MTGKVSQTLGRMQESRIPATCPKCGVWMPEPLGASLASHLTTKHPGAIGYAIPRVDRIGVENRGFAYVAPVPQASGIWIVVWLDWPYEVARLDRQVYRVAWKVGDGPDRKE